MATEIEGPGWMPRVPMERARWGMEPEQTGTRVVLDIHEQRKLEAFKKALPAAAKFQGRCRDCRMRIPVGVLAAAGPYRTEYWGTMPHLVAEYILCRECAMARRKNGKGK
jgi:hypothetical protein